MRVFSEIDRLPAGLRFAVTLGIFDGVHRGHRRVLKETVSIARQMAAEPVAITFDPHPEAVLRGRQPPALCDPAERLARIAAMGVAITVVQPFDRQFSEQSPEAFIRRLTTRRDMAALLMTPESAFGRDRTGTIAEIERLSSAIGFRLVHVEPLVMDGAAVSSSRIRDLLRQGSLAEARRLIGRNYAVVGEVSHGATDEQRTILRFREPTALPGSGAYRVAASWGGKHVLRPRRRVEARATMASARSADEAATPVLTLTLPTEPRPAAGERVRVEFVAPVDAEPGGAP